MLRAAVVRRAVPTLKRCDEPVYLPLWHLNTTIYGHHAVLCPSTAGRLDELDGRLLGLLQNAPHTVKTSCRVLTFSFSISLPENLGRWLSTDKVRFKMGQRENGGIDHV